MKHFSLHDAINGISNNGPGGGGDGGDGGDENYDYTEERQLIERKASSVNPPLYEEDERLKEHLEEQLWTTLPLDQQYRMISEPLEIQEGPVFECLMAMSMAETGQPSSPGDIPVDNIPSPAAIVSLIDEALAFIYNYQEALEQYSDLRERVVNEFGEFIDPTRRPAGEEAIKRQAISYYFDRDKGSPVDKPELLSQGIKGQLAKLQGDCKSPKEIEELVKNDEEALRRFEQDKEELEEKYQLISANPDEADEATPIGTLNDLLTFMEQLAAEGRSGDEVAMLADKATDQLALISLDTTQYVQMVARITDSATD